MAAVEESTQREESLEIYTDGACSKNGKEGAVAGIGVYLGMDDPRNISSVLEMEPHTNNRAELWAIKKALDIIEKENPVKGCIYTDSQYSKNALTEWMPKWKKNNWVTASKTPVKNQDMLKIIDEQLLRLCKTVQLKFVYVKGHSGEMDGNYMADKLATEAIIPNPTNDSSEKVKRQRVE